MKCGQENQILKTHKRYLMKGYKAFYADWTCMNNYQYKVGETYEMEGLPKLCACGFHFCQVLMDLFKYYQFGKCKIAEVEAYGDIAFALPSDYDDSKRCTNKIKILREIPYEEIPDIAGMKRIDSAKFIDITLLSVGKYDACNRYIRRYGWGSWWLRVSDVDSPLACRIQKFENCAPLATQQSRRNEFFGGYINNSDIGVRPALICDLSSFGLHMGNRVWLAGYPWTIISNDTILCDMFVGKTYFDDISNDYDRSHIKRWLHEWAATNEIELTKE